jgi:hypothetical protein
MVDDKLNLQIRQLAEELDYSVARTKQLTQKTRNCDLQELLDYLRVCIKYVVLDLEATRRERDYFQRLVEGVGRVD